MSHSQFAEMVMELRRFGLSLNDTVLNRFEQIPPELFGLDMAQMIQSGAIQLLAARLYALQLGEDKSASDVSNGFMLEVGTGNAYAAALCAGFVRRLYTIERDRPKWQAAQANFARLGISNITAKLAEGSQGWPEMAPFARISVNPALGEVPDALMQQVAPGGILSVILPPTPEQAASGAHVLTRITKKEAGLESEPVCLAQVNAIDVSPLWQTKSSP